MQPGQGGYRTNNTMALASGPQAGQSNLGQPNPTAQQQFIQQQSMQRLGLGLSQQQQQQQLGAIQHSALGNANHLNLAQGNNPALMSLMGMQGNAMGQLNNQIMSNLRNPNVLDMQHRLDPGMSDQVRLPPPSC
jgi:hypothetical protein